MVKGQGAFRSASTVGSSAMSAGLTTGQQGSITQDPDRLLQLAEVAASADAPVADPAPRAFAAHISASVSAFSQSLAAQHITATGTAHSTPSAALPQQGQHRHQQLAAAEQPSPLQANVDDVSDIGASLLQHLALTKVKAAPLARQPAGPRQQNLQQARQPAAGSAAAPAASAAAHCSDAALQAALPQAGVAASPADGAGCAEDGIAAFMSMLSARSTGSPCSSPEQGPEEDDSDYAPRNRQPSARPHDGRPHGGRRHVSKLPSGKSTGRDRPHAMWTPEEHARLLEVVAQLGEDWTTVASCMPGRSSKQCRERYLNNKPELKKGNWTIQEDLVLAQLHCKLGKNKWTMFEQYLPGRSHNDMKNRWNSVQRSRRKDLAKSSSNVLWDYIHCQQQGMTRAEALAAAKAALPAADPWQLDAVAGDADVAAAAPAAARHAVAFTAAADAAPVVYVHPAALLLLQQQQQPAAEPVQGTAGLDALAVAAAMVLPAANSHQAAGAGSTPKTEVDEPQAAAAAEARVIATADVKQAAAQPLNSTAVARHSAHSNQPWQLHVPAAEWQQPRARALEQDQHGVHNLQQQVMAPEQRMAAAALAAGAHTRPVLDLSDSAHGRQQQQQQQGSRNDRGEVGGSAAAAAPGSVELLHPSPAAAGGSMVSGLSGLVLEIMGQQQPQQLQTCSVAAGALSAAAPAPHTGRRLPAARQDRQEAPQQHLAPKVLPLQPPQQDTATAPEDPTVATWWEQQERHCTGGQQQAPPLPPPAAAAAAAEAVAAANTLAAGAACGPSLTAAVHAAAAAGAPAQQVSLVQLAATAEGRAVLASLRALQLLPAELPAGAQLTVRLVVQQSPGTSGSAQPSVPAVADAADGVAAVCAEPNSPAGSSCGTWSKVRAMTPCAAAATAASASQGATTYAVGGKRPISAELPGEALTVDAAAHHVLVDWPQQEDGARSRKKRPTDEVAL
ncbi:hypothetical protein COO60DRAFT_1700284 [Scenedesmus sp. NREL 46B-D3]|nr:hypothetical protein COO60DRAFT_1700284 [Scenedesmus sp. NREL 46B-D3]